MKLSALSTTDIWQRMRGQGLCLQAGPFRVQLRGGHRRLAEQLQLLNPEMAVGEVDDGQILDFQVRLSRPLGLRRWFKPQISLQTARDVPYEPFPMDHALPLFEWGLN